VGGGGIKYRNVPGKNIILDHVFHGRNTLDDGSSAAAVLVKQLRRTNFITCIRLHIITDSNSGIHINSQVRKVKAGLTVVPVL
jgi:hypothetical protein